MSNPLTVSINLVATFAMLTPPLVRWFIEPHGFIIVVHWFTVDSCFKKIGSLHLWFNGV